MNQPFDTVQKLGKDSADAAQKALGAITQGVQAIAVEATDFAKKSLEQSTTTLEQLAGARTLDKAIEIQTDYLRNAYEGVVAQSAKMGELYANLGRDALRPYEGLVTKPATTA